MSCMGFKAYIDDGAKAPKELENEKFLLVSVGGLYFIFVM